MTEQDARKILEEILCAVSKKKVSLDNVQDLRNDKVLDSLDALIFFMELEQKTGVVVPESASLVADGWFTVDKLCKAIVVAPMKE